MITPGRVQQWVAAHMDDAEVVQLDSWLLARGRLHNGYHVTLRLPRYGDAMPLIAIATQAIESEDAITAKVECLEDMVDAMLLALNALPDLPTKEGKNDGPRDS